MEIYYSVIIIILFTLGVSGLIVGVSNDAVNFINPAIGAKTASFKIILLVSSIGIVIGSTFSNGMMDVARNSIFNPSMFYYNEVMILFIGVMITNVVLLDFFNTFGLPTSTSVSIVFSLLGASVGISIIKLSKASEQLGNLAFYINSDRALGIISGIFVSIIIAFTFGLIIQWIIRIIFTFNITKTIRYWGGIWGGISLAIIIYFLLVKGVQGSSLVNQRSVLWIQNHNEKIFIYSFILGTIIFQISSFLFKTGTLKIIVLIGTFALAMAFAGNDLVNFIGVPLAGFESYNEFIKAGSAPDQLKMTFLQDPVNTPTLLLLSSGLIMIITLFFSRKARTVASTTINLSRQEEGFERFESSFLARLIVRWTLDAGSKILKYLPERMVKLIEKRTDPSLVKGLDNGAFDLLRASVNLVISSILIASGTSLKLPLSTTYVTFMVAMGSSLADGAWGRESAVYRISGVITVIGGWFVTAFIAFLVAFLTGIVISLGGAVVILILLIIAVLLMLRAHIIHKKRENDIDEINSLNLKKYSAESIFITCSDTLRSNLSHILKLYQNLLSNFVKEKRKSLKNFKQDIKELNDEASKQKNNIYLIIRKLREDEIESGHHNMQVLDNIVEATNSLYQIYKPVYAHIDNNHPPLNKDQTEDLLKFSDRMSDFFNLSIDIVKSNNYALYEDLVRRKNDLISLGNSMKRNQIKHLKKLSGGTKVTMLFLEIMTESRNLVTYTINAIEAQKDFYQHMDKWKKPYTS